MTTVEVRRLDIEVAVYDNADLIGKGTHTRFIVDAERFLDKTYAKLNQ